MINLLEKFLQNQESEIIEYKEAKGESFSFNDIGKYFSALSNESNLNGINYGWLLFGITDDGTVCGTNFRKSGGLQNLKKEIANKTNQRMTFKNIHELNYKSKRVIIFQIPAAIPGIPTTWNGQAFSREKDSLVPLPLNKLDEIRRQQGYDWSKQIIESATIDDLDAEAIKVARENFYLKHSESATKIEVLKSMSDIDILNKAGVTIQGKITNTALILLGKEEAVHFFDGLIPRITWTLYNADNTIKSYEHFDPPFLLSVDKVYNKIRNEKYRYIAGQMTLFPLEVDQYEPDLIRELLHNCIAHQDYKLKGKINVLEYEDKLVFINEGNFIPQTIERALEQGYKPPYYRNAFLARAMVNLNMIDTDGIGIPKIFKMQIDKYFPLPSYNLENENRVIVSIYGKILDTNYTKLLHEKYASDIETVFLLDKVQKREKISKDDAAYLKKHKLIEGRYPNIYISYKIAELVGKQADYIKTKGLDEGYYKDLILEYIHKFKSAKKHDLVKLLNDKLPDNLSEKQKDRKIRYFLTTMRKEGIIMMNSTNKVSGSWVLTNQKTDNIK